MKTLFVILFVSPVCLLLCAGWLAQVAAMYLREEVLGQPARHPPSAGPAVPLAAAAR
jgi:hypothetical protein